MGGMMEKHIVNQSVFCLFLLFLHVLLVNTVMAHGVVHSFSQGNAVLVKASYADETPMSFADVEIFSPFESKLEHQNGRTDKNGCFAFLPDRQGVWTVFVNDGKGHAFSERIMIDDLDSLSAPIVSSRHDYGTVALIAGTVFGMLGIAFYLRARSLTVSKKQTSLKRQKEKVKS